MRWARNFIGVVGMFALLLAAIGQFRFGILRCYEIDVANTNIGTELVIYLERGSQVGPKFYCSLIDRDPASAGSIWPILHTYDGPSAAGTHLKYVLINIPHWLTNLVVWSLFFILWRKTRSHPKGHCQRCGYDLTGNESGRCPECNAGVAA